MGYRREPIAIGEWYHCYNRGIDKRKVFDSEKDCERFLQSLYLSNDAERTGRNDFDYIPHARIFVRERSSPLVSIGAYCLMPNHFHILMQEVVEGGISKFMHKLGTSYTMYFNEKNERTGNLFYKPFRSRHVQQDSHFRHIPDYIHLNAAELFDPEWKKRNLKSLHYLHNKLMSYPFSSFIDYCGIVRPESNLLDANATATLRESMTSTSELVLEAADYLNGLKM